MYTKQLSRIIVLLLFAITSCTEVDKDACEKTEWPISKNASFDISVIVRTPFGQGIENEPVKVIIDITPCRSAFPTVTKEYSGKTDTNGVYHASSNGPFVFAINNDDDEIAITTSLPNHDGKYLVNFWGGYEINDGYILKPLIQFSVP